MTKDDWLRKLCSRKFWAAVAGFVAGLIAFIKSPSESPEAVTSLIMAFGTLVAYIVGEGLADAAGAKTNVMLLQDDLKPPEDGDEG